MFRMLLVGLWLVYAASTPIEIVQALDSPQSQKINLMKAFRQYYRRVISIGMISYQCITPIKDLNSKQKTSKQLFSKPLSRDEQAFDQLQLLEGESSIHYTTTFLYEYKHKKLIRQFDDENTKTRNAKKQHEDILMGVYKLTKNEVKVLTRQQQLQEKEVYEHSDAMAQETSNISIQIDHDSNVVRLNKVLYYQKNGPQIQYMVKCKVYAGSQYTEVGYVGIAISHFELAIQGKFICKEISHIFNNTTPQKKPHPIRHAGNIIYGDVNEACGIDDDPIKVGNILLIEQVVDDENYVTETVWKTLVRVQKMIGEQAFRINHKINPLRKINKCSRVAEEDVGLLGNVNQLLSSFQSQTMIKGIYYRKPIMKFHYDLEVGEKLYCFMGFNHGKKYAYYKLIHLMAGKPIGAFRQMYFLQNPSDPYSLYENFEYESIFTCSRQKFISRQEPQKNPESGAKFSKMMMLEEGSTFYPENEDVIYGISPSSSAVIELETEVGGKVNKYILTSNKIYKIQILNNQTKLQTSQNSYYENSTSTSMIMIYKGFWRVGDRLKFPRILMDQNQKITNIKIKYGFGYIRQIDLTVLGHNSYLMSSPFLRTHTGYGPYQRPKQSLSTQKRFKDGLFCAGTISKFRQTLIKIKCGQPWFLIEQIQETSPCVYEVRVSSQFLCGRDHEMPTLGNSIIPYNGTICYPI